MTSEITPIEQAFEMIGLQQCSALLQFLFIESLAGKAIFAVGFFLALSRSLKNADFRQVIVYTAVFFACFLLVILPQQSMTAEPSMMEQRSYGAITTADIIKKSAVEPLKVSPVLLVTAQSLAVLRNSVIDLIDNNAPHENRYLADPFCTFKLWLMTHERIRRGITGQPVRGELLAFYHDTYYPALRSLSESKASGFSKMWPGDESLLSQYGKAESAQWEKIRLSLYDQVNFDGLFSRVAEGYYNGADIESDVVKALIEHDTIRDPESYIFLSFTGKEQRWIQAGQRFAPDEGLLVASTRTALSGLPYIYGVLLWVMWVGLPFMLIYWFMTMNGYVPGGYLRCLAAVKLLPVVWAVMDRASVAAFDIAMGMGANKLWLWEMNWLGWFWWAGLVISLGGMFLILGVRLGR